MNLHILTHRRERNRQIYPPYNLSIGGLQFNIIVIIITISGIINLYGGVVVKSYTIELKYELYVIYVYIAKINEKKVEVCLVIILERVILKMIHKSEPEKEMKA